MYGHEPIVAPPMPVFGTPIHQFPKALGKALLTAQGKMRGIAKDGTNPHYKSRYASLESVTDTIRPVLQEVGIVFMQAPGSVDEHGVMALTTWLVHAESGETFSATIGVPLVKRDPQGVGSAITYACRYSLMALLGLPPVDDDGEGAGKAETATPLKVLNKQESKVLYAQLQEALRRQPDEKLLKVWITQPAVKNMIAQLPPDWQENLRTDYHEKLTLMREQE